MIQGASTSSLNFSRAQIASLSNLSNFSFLLAKSSSASSPLDLIASIRFPENGGVTCDGRRLVDKELIMITPHQEAVFHT